MYSRSIIYYLSSNKSYSRQAGVLRVWMKFFSYQCKHKIVHYSKLKLEKKNNTRKFSLSLKCLIQYYMNLIVYLKKYYIAVKICYLDIC